MIFATAGEASLIVRAPVQAKPLRGMSNQLNLRSGGTSRGDTVLRPIENEDFAIYRERGDDVGILWLVTGLVHLARMIDLLDNVEFDNHRLTGRPFRSVPANLAPLLVVLLRVWLDRLWDFHLGDLKMIGLPFSCVGSKQQPVNGEVLVLDVLYIGKPLCC